MRFSIARLILLAFLLTGLAYAAAVVADIVSTKLHTAMSL